LCVLSVIVVLNILQYLQKLKIKCIYFELIAKIAHLPTVVKEVSVFQQAFFC
jgi:hypothetical protein